MDNIKNKNIIIAIVIIMVGILIIGGTYAYLSISATVTNGNYATSTRCFDIDYDDGYVEPENIIGTVSSYSRITVNDGNYQVGYVDGLQFGDVPYITFNFSESLQAGKNYTLSFNASADFTFTGYQHYKFPSATDDAVVIQDGTNTLNFTVTETISQGSIFLDGDLYLSGSLNEYSITLSDFSLYEAEAPSTLFPSGDAYAGITESVSVKTTSLCNTTGRGTLYLHIDGSTDPTLVGAATAHCEKENTLETLTDYDNQTDCLAANGTKWVTNGTVLKYAVFSGSDLYNSGYITSTDIGTDKIVHSDFSVTGTQKQFDVYIWLDGNISGNTHINLPFSASTKMNVRQTKSTDTTFLGDTPLVVGYLDQLEEIHSEIAFNPLYQRVEYIRGTGSQYINTGLSVQTNDEFETKSSTSVTGNYKTIIAANNVFELYYNSPNLATWKNISVLSGQTTDINLDEAYIHRTKVTAAGDNLEIFSYNAGYRLNGKIYYVNWYRNGKMIANFIPVSRKADSKPGLYDTVSGTFYTNAATSGDDFTVGPDV